MSVTIKHIDGNTLYVAESATNVRQAVEEAAEAGADLAGADLAGAYLSRADLARADLARADLAGAYLSGADLARANLAGADLAGADLARANLSGADLAGADLAGAYLSGADLAGAKGINTQRVNDLLILKDQPGKIRAYKLVTAEGYGPFNGGIQYAVGGSYEVADANTDEMADCGAGINLATMPWVLRNWEDGYRILVAEFTAKDIAAIPVSDGKFRVRRCRIVAEKTLEEFGLAEGDARG